eukprot:5042-Heterococcus_DN1.PRE.1
MTDIQTCVITASMCTYEAVHLQCASALQDCANLSLPQTRLPALQHCLLVLAAAAALHQLQHQHQNQCFLAADVERLLFLCEQQLSVLAVPQAARPEAVLLVLLPELQQGRCVAREG